MSRHEYHITYNDRTKRLYIADNYTAEFTITQGDEAEAFHNAIRNKVENPPWSESQANEELESSQVDRSAAARLLGKTTR